MANKRQLKRAIRYACSEMVGECFFAEDTIEGADLDKWDNIIVNIALLQAEAVNRVSVDFDKKPKDFDSKKAYNVARRAFFKQAEKDLAKYMREETEKIAKEMNALVPKSK